MGQNWAGMKASQTSPPTLEHGNIELTCYKAAIKASRAVKLYYTFIKVLYRDEAEALEGSLAMLRF